MAKEEHPMFYGGDIKYCDAMCPFFKQKEDYFFPLAKCLKDDQDIEFYDWYLSHCKESDNLSDNQ